MKKLLSLILFMVMFLVGGVCFADVLTLNQTQQEATPTVVSLDWRHVNINLVDKKVVIIYRKLNSLGREIPMTNGRVNRTWTCQNMTDDPDTPENEASTCWTDVFMFEIKTQHAGMTIGRGLRDLLKNKMKNDTDVIDPGNDGTFND